MPAPKSSFIVVECQTAPNNSNKRVCVPKSWVKCEISEKKVAIAYPAEDETCIAKRIENNEAADDAWTHYIGDIKYEAVSYEDAMAYGFLKNGENGKQIEENNFENDAATKPKDSLKLRIVLPKLKLKSEKKNSLKKHSKKYPKNKIHKSKHRSVENESLKENKLDLKKVSRKNTSSDDIHCTKAKDISLSEPILNCQNKVENSQRNLESKIEDLIIGSLKDTLKQLNDNNLNTDTSKKSHSGGLDFKLDKAIDLTNVNLTPEDQRKLRTLDNEQRHTLACVKSAMVNLTTLYLKVTADNKALASILSKYKTFQPSATDHIEASQQNGHALEEESTQSDDMETLRFDELDSEDDFDDKKDVNENNDTTINIEQEDLPEEMDTEMYNDSDFETFIDDEESSLDSLPSSLDSLPSSPQVVKRKKNYISKHSKCTLKHPKPGKGLVPLGRRDSGVYISAKALNKIKLTSDCVSMFARLLFKEVFTPEALRSCSMTGKKPSRNTKFIRPPLNARARTLIVNYAMSYGRQVGWKEIKINVLEHRLRCLLQRSRKIKKQKGEWEEN